MLEEHVYINAWLFRARNKNNEEKVFSLLTQVRWDVVHGQDHWPSIVVTHPLIEEIHSIRAQGESYIPWVLAKVFVVNIEVFPLTTIGRVCNLIIIHLALIIPPCHECGFLRV
jgi:hypothetical protein